MGYDPLHFSLVVVVTLLVGAVTPPLGILVYIAGGIADVDVISVFGDVLPFVGVFVLRGAGTVAGMAILSSFPPVECGVLDAPADAWDLPRVLWARLADGPADGLLVVNVHLRNPLGPILPILPLHRPARDRQRQALAAWTASRLEQGERLLVGGDFNTVDCRLEWLTIVADALDRPLATWRPYGIPFAPPVLRIDHLFLGGRGVEPTTLATDCRPTGSDHCALVATLAVSGVG
jgi:endonuclease/exonuclease/phosphatase family metal-dependent hydrolase